MGYKEVKRMQTIIDVQSKRIRPSGNGARKHCRGV